MEELAGRILAYSQQPGSSGSCTNDTILLARMLMGQLLCWEDLAYGLLCMWTAMQMLHLQCLLAASDDAELICEAEGASSSDSGAVAGGSSTKGGSANISSSSSTTTTTIGTDTGTSSSSAGSRVNMGGRTHTAAASSSGTSTSRQHAAAASTVAGKGGMPWRWPAMQAYVGELHAAASLHITTAWLRPNLVRLLHAWLQHVPERHMELAADIRTPVWGWAHVQKSPSMHPAVLQLGITQPAVAAAAAQRGCGALVQLQVGSREAGSITSCITKMCVCRGCP
jgi:hypothetical protein